MAIVNADNFLKHVAKIELEYQASIVQVKSQSGRRRAQRRGPLLYNMEMTVEPAQINSEKYYDIIQFIQNLNYGNNTVVLPIDSSVSTITTPRGSWGTPVVTTANQVGQSITIRDSARPDIDGYASPFDYVQFQGSSKVYQVSAVVDNTSPVTIVTSDDYDTDASGDVTLNLNTPLVIAPPITGTGAVTFGENVKFHMAMMEKPKITYLPGNIVEFGDFRFEEVIENVTL